jgi:Holliday junction DNA helicase RuvA
MITYVKGKLTEKNPSYAIIEANGIGYFINISLQTYSALGSEENCKLLTYLSVKEDSHTLFGFSEDAERELFIQLISVSGIGTNTARMMLSSLSSNEIIKAIATENVNALKGIKGIGLKTAQRVIIDLKDKVGKNLSIENISTLSNNTIKDEALSALMVLGFDKKTAEGRIDAMISKNPQIKDVEELIKYSLKNL